MANTSPELRISSLDMLAIRSRPLIDPSQITQFIKNQLDAEIYSDQLRRRE